MKKVKLDARIENAFNAFFENDEQFENSQIVLRDNSALLQNPPAKKITEKFDSVISLIKYIFLFLPGAFFLCKLPMTFVDIAMRWGLPEFDLGGYLFLTFFLLAGSFMTFVGVGSLRETKNLIVPASIISFSLLLGTVFSLFPDPLRGQLYSFHSIYLFPLALIMAGLAKHWVNKNEKSEN